jgi:hypothetical protein
MAEKIRPEIRVKTIMKRTIYRAVIIMICFSAAVTESQSAEIDPTLENLDISGFLRIRHWNLTSKTQVGSNFDYSDDYKNTYYEDLFFRNRFYLKALPNVQVRAVFDVSAKLGKGGFALGSGETNLITRDVYMVINPTESSELSLGLRPFSLPGGYILARDASGVQYDHSFMKNSFNLYVAFVKAYDDADDSFGNNSDPPKYADDNVYFGGMKMKFMPTLTNELYYVYEHDSYEDVVGGSDERKSRLHWIGFHNNFMTGGFHLKLGGIYNRGTLYLWDSTASQFNKTDVSAGLFEFDAGYRVGSFQVSAVAEGATGDASNAGDKNSFQDIKASHGFSFIVVDNLGGLAYRGSGESSWYGLYGYGLRVRYALFDSVTMVFKGLDFRTTKEFEFNGTSSNWLGSEIDFRAEYIYREALSVFLTAGLFFPRDAYDALVSYDTKGVVAEIMAGARVNY